MNTLKHYWLIILLFPFSLSAQSNVEAGIFLGIANYQGDLSPSPIAASETKPALGGLYRYMFTSKFAVKGSVIWGMISGRDKNIPNFDLAERNWSMRSNIFELAVHGEWHPFGALRYNNTGLFDRQYSPFISIGIGGAFTDPKLVVPAEDRFKIPEPNATSTFLVLPVSAGLRLDLTEDFLLGLDFGTRITFSDYLDGVSLNGNNQKNDWYFFAGISILYVIEEKVGGKANW